MPTQQRSEGNSYNLTLAEIAILDLTNGETQGNFPGNLAKNPLTNPRPNYDEIYMLTTKEVYLWGVVLSKLVRDKKIEPSEVIRAYDYAIKNNRQLIRDNYSKLSFQDDQIQNSKTNIPHLILTDFVNEFGYDEEFISKAKEQTTETYKSLVDRKIIEDPIVESVFGIPLAVAGFIPYGFTKKTRKGEVISRKIKAPLWKYEYEQKDDEQNYEFKLRLLKVLNAFKEALIKITEEEVEMDG